MDPEHTFLLQPGKWAGEGHVMLSTSSNPLNFKTEWTAESESQGEIACDQKIVMEGSKSPLVNRFLLFDIRQKEFKMTLENSELGQMIGSGLIDKTFIAWEFREEIVFHGYEVYKREGQGLYQFHAEYAHPGQFRTIIDGHIRKVGYAIEF